MIDPILNRPLRAIAAGLADGSLNACDVTERAIGLHDPTLDAYMAWEPSAARQQALAAGAAFAAGVQLGGLQGIPVSFKDLYGVAGMATFAGTPRALPAAWSAEGPLVTRLRHQLGVIVGKTQSVEFAFGGLGTSRHHPVPWNPRDLHTHRAPGGSSSGAGVSVIEGTALVAFGTDTGGSVRIPASLTGCFGLKTTLGRWSTDGIVPLSPSFDTPGILTRTADDAAFAFGALDGEPVPKVDGGKLRLAIAPAFFWQDCDPGIAEQVEAALLLIEAAGAHVTNRDLPGCEEVFDAYRLGGIVSAELYAFLRGHLPQWLETLDPRVRRRMDDGRALEAWEYLQRKARYLTLGAGAAAAFDGIDAMISPTIPITPPAVALLADPETYARLNLAVLRNTCVVSFLGLCAVTLPAGTDAKGMPVGLQIIGPPQCEPRLLAIARHIELILAGADVWPLPV
jgi:aspartyl-tRNA(Asn)/glutamyl-tRNA(Gln) amidotransferase subunit A